MVESENDGPLVSIERTLPAIGHETVARTLNEICNRKVVLRECLVSDVIRRCNAGECQDFTILNRPSAVSMVPVPPFMHRNAGMVPVNCVLMKTPQVHPDAVHALPKLLYQLVQRSPMERQRWPMMSWVRAADVHRLLVALTAAFDSSPVVVQTVQKALSGVSVSPRG